MQDKEHTNDDTSNRRGRSSRAAFLIDGENYFRAVAEAVRKAERSVLLVGWDIDSRLLLERDPDGPRLYELLNDLAKERPDVHVHILIWDYPLAYSMDREPLQMISFARKTPKNVHFHLDSEFPMGSSHHQKIVTVDDKIAFSGGMDLSSGRWDTMEHLPDDDRRTAPNGEKYTPYHDVQMVLDGEPAKALADIARERWLWATGHCLTPPEKTEGDPWPDSVTPDMHDEEITISLTIPKYKERAEIREIERMYLREIDKADARIYMENQYFTSKPIKEALASRLREPDGPEVVIILPHTPTGLVERLVMEPLQSEVLDSLHESDEYDRLEVYCPFSDEDGNSPVKVHAKVMIIDDEFATVGSANLNNRSMGLDTECNLDFRPVRSKGALTNFRRKLLAHHLGISPERLEEEERSGCTMCECIEKLRNETKRLRPELETRNGPPVPVDPEFARPLDPAQPGTFDAIMDDYTGPDNSRRGYSGFINLGIVLAAFIAMALAWRYTPLSEYADTALLLEWTNRVRELPMAPLFGVLGFIIGGFVMFPVTILIILTAGIFGPATAVATSLAGSLLSSSLIYLVGSLLGHDAVKHVTGSRINAISKQLGRFGVTSIIVVRILPVAPFTIINLVAGASHISLRNFLMGTVIGMAPGILGMTLFGGQLMNALRDPGPVTISVLVLIVALIMGLGFVMKRRLRSIQDPQEESINRDGEQA